MSAKPDISDADVDALVRRLLGEAAVLSPVGTPGMETHAYRVTTPDRAACLRIGRSTRTSQSGSSKKPQHHIGTCLTGGGVRRN